MSGPLPLALRVRAVEAVENGEGTHAEVASRFKIGVATLGRWVRRKREGKPLAAKWERRGPPRKVRGHDLEVLRGILERTPDATIERITELFARESGMPVSTSTVGRAIREDLGWSRKKRR